MLNKIIKSIKLILSELNHIMTNSTSTRDIYRHAKYYRHDVYMSNRYMELMRNSDRKTNKI